MERRRRRVICVFLLLVAGGLLYRAWIQWTGWAIPCLFYQVTGLECPGCGVTRMCLALMQFRLDLAWKANAGLMLLLPALLWLGIRLTLEYIQTGSWRGGRQENLVAMGLIGWLVFWGLLRNFI